MKTGGLCPVDFTFKVEREEMSQPLGTKDLNKLLWRIKT